MKKILYLHGLESKQGGEKVDYLAKKGYVCAPEIDYTRSDIFLYLLRFMDEFEPDLIVGSSMGGYSAFILGGLYDIPVVAFNPALHSRRLEPNFPKFVKEHIPNKLDIIIGAKDALIDGDTTLKWLKDHIKNKYVTHNIHRVDTMGHRVPFDVFTDIYNKIIK